MSAIKIIQGLARKSLIKDQGSGIRSIPSVMEAEAKAGEIAAILQSGGMPLQQLDDYIRSEKDLLKYLNIIKNANKPRVIAGDSLEGKGIMEALLGKRGEVVDMAGKKLDTSQGIMGGKSVKELMDSGQVTKGARGMKKSKKVQDREMFQDANKRLTSDVDSIIKDIQSMEPITAMKEANSVIARKGKYKNLTQEQSKKILQDTEDHIFERYPIEDPEDFATGGRAEFKGGGLTESDYLKVKDMLNHYKDYRKGGGTMSKKKFGIAFFRENNADGGVAGLLGERPGYRSAGFISGRTKSSKSKSSASKGPAGGASAGGNYGGNVNPQQTYAGRTLSQRPSNYGGTKPTTVTPSGGSNIKTGPYLGSTINFKTSRNPFKNYKRHAILANMLKKQMIPGGNIPNYHQISAYDFDNRLGLPNPVSKSLATGYQYLSEAKKALTNPNYNFSDATSRAKEESRLNKMGIEGLSSKDMQNYQRALDYTNIDSLDDMRTFKAKYLADGGPARQNFKMGKRAFLKMLAGTGAGIVGLKSGLFGLGGKEVTKKAVTETVKSAGSGTPPPYFFKLVDKIKFMGDDVLATQDKAIAKKYKDYVLEEDFAGNISITRKGDMDAPGYEEVYMGYSVDDVPLKGKKGSTKVEEYEEYTVRPDGDGKMKDVEDGVPEDVLDDAGDPDSMTLKKASGGIARMLGE